MNNVYSASEHLSVSLPEAVLSEKIEFLCYFSSLRILELVCENAKTQATPQSTVSPLTHSYTQGLEAGLPCSGAETTTAKNRCSHWQGTDPKNCQGPC